MTLSVHYSQDIQNAILAAEQAMSSAILTSRGGDYSLGFEAGYRSALTTMALAFGLVKQAGVVQLSWVEE